MVLQSFSKRYLNLALAGVLMSQMALLSACAPPSAKQAKLPGEGGRPVEKVAEKKKETFKTVEVDGVEMIEARGDVGKFGGTFYDISIGEGPKTFNSWDSTDATSSEMASRMYVGLVDTDAYTGAVVPLLAKSVELQSDKRTYRVILRKGLKWSDGKPITSDDVVFTWNDIIGKGFGNTSQRDVNLIQGKFPTVRALDPLTVEFVTAEPFAPFMRNLGQAIAPAHILRPVVKQGKKAFSSTWGVPDAQHHPEKFVVNGMFQLEKYNPVEKRVVFKRNPNYFFVDKKGQRLPYLDRYSIMFVSDFNNQQLQFEQGNSDTYAIPPDRLAVVRKLTRPEFKIYNLGPTTSSTFVMFNLNNRKDKHGKPYIDPVKSSWFRKTEFRQAVDYAINRQDIVQNIIKGVGQPLFTPESLNSIFLNKKLANGHPQDIEKAKALLKKAGFTWNAKQQLLDDKGRLVEFNLLTNAGNSNREAIGVQVKDDLAKLGMKVNFRPIEFNVLIGQIDDKKWDAVVMGLTGGTLEPNMGANVWQSFGRLHMFNQRDLDTASGMPDLSDRFPWEKQLDDIFYEGAKTFDTAERRAIYDKYQQIAYDEQPFIYLYSPLQMIAAKKRLQNIDPTPLASLHNLEEIWIKE